MLQLAQRFCLDLANALAAHLEALSDLRGVVEREKAAIGVFITLRPPTKAMQKEAASAGFYQSDFGHRYPRLQILTIEDLLAGKRVEYPVPRYSNITLRKAPREPSKKPEQQELPLAKASTQPRAKGPRKAKAAPKRAKRRRKSS